MSIWPVPANNVLYVNYSATHISGLSTLEVYNVDGRMVVNKEMKSSFDTKLNVANMPSGIYVLKLTNGEGSMTKKLIINH